MDEELILLVPDDEYEDERNASIISQVRRMSRPTTSTRKRVRRVVSVKPSRPRPLVMHAPARQSFLDRLSTGEWIELATEVFAAMQPLPERPPAASAAVTNLENLIEYQRALSEHAKANERIRTLGATVNRLIA